MNSDFVTYQLEDRIATVRIDDGKRNALSPEVLRGIYRALDQARSDHATVILTGRESVFSAGFDLRVMMKGGIDAIRMLRLGFSLTAKVLEYPYPVVVASNGHVMAMGVFLMLSGDYIIGCRGDFKVAANEVAIGMKMPRVAAAMLQHRLNPAAFQRAVALAEVFDPEKALRAGFFDELAEESELLARARMLAADYSELDTRAHTSSKRRIRASLIRRIRLSVPLDLLDAMWAGIRR